MTMTISTQTAKLANNAGPGAIASAASRQPTGTDNAAGAGQPARADAATSASASSTERSPTPRRTEQPAPPAAAPRFAQLLGRNNGAATLTAASDEPTATQESDAADAAGVANLANLDNTANTATATNAANAAALLPAMAGSLYGAVQLASTTTAPAAPAEAGSTGRGDTVASATLFPAATSFNLSAANVAVNPVNAAAGAVPTAGYAAIQDANQMALAQQAARLTEAKQTLPLAAVATAPISAAAASAADTSAVTGGAVAAAPAAVANDADQDVPGTPSSAASVLNPALAIGAAPAPRTAAIAAAPAPATAPASATAQPRVAVRSADLGADSAGTVPPITAQVAKEDGQGGAKFGATLAATANGAVSAAPAPAAAPAGNNAGVIKLAGAPDQWQQPLREALGERLQVNLQRNNNQAVIRLDPPNMGSIEISIRQSAGALQVNLSASNSEVVRQLNAIGDSVRQDLSSRQFSDVAVTVSTARGASQSTAQSFAQAQSDGGRQQPGQQEQREQDRGRTPGRALYQDGAAPTFAMYDQE